VKSISAKPGVHHPVTDAPYDTIMYAAAFARALLQVVALEVELEARRLRDWAAGR
jgi:hypothetical protein